MIELAKSTPYDQLPTQDLEELARWFHHGANQGSLPMYLGGLTHTIAVMQTAEALERVAHEQAADLSQYGVHYFETRVFGGLKRSSTCFGSKQVRRLVR